MFPGGINDHCVQNLRNLPADSSGAVFRSLRLASALPRSTKHCDSGENGENGENGVSLIGGFPLCTESEPKVVITDNLKSRLEYVHYVCSSPGPRVPTFDNLYDYCKGGRSTNPAPFLQRHVTFSSGCSHSVILGPKSRTARVCAPLYRSLTDGLRSNYRKHNIHTK